MAGFTMVLLNFVMIPSVIISVILSIFSIFIKNANYRRICLTIAVILPDFLCWLIFYIILQNVFNIPFEYSPLLAFLILVIIVTLLLILIWRKKKNAD
jgi:hypothetical protein